VTADPIHLAMLSDIILIEEAINRVCAAIALLATREQSRKDRDHRLG